MCSGVWDLCPLGESQAHCVNIARRDYEARHINQVSNHSDMESNCHNAIKQS